MEIYSLYILHQFVSSNTCNVVYWCVVQTEFEEEFNGTVLLSILAAIAESTPADSLKPWLSQTFIPFVIRQLPEGLVIKNVH